MARFFDDMLLSEIRERNDIVDLISAHTDLKRSGGRYLGLCPFHREKTPSFFVSKEDGLYYCFGCHEGGNIITFVEKINNLDFLEAVKYLADRAGIHIPEKSGEIPEDIQLKKTIYEINVCAAKYFHNSLRNNKEAYAYLTDRGVTSKTITEFGLGYAENTWAGVLEHLQNKGYSKNAILKSGLISQKDDKCYDFFRGRIIFPVIDLRGNVVAFGGRVLDNSLPKYLNTSDTLVFHKRNNLFSFNNAKNTRKDYLLLAEGYMDVIALYQYGFTNAVASLGTAFGEDHARLIKRYAKNVVICYDSDEAGQNAVHKAADLLQNEGIKVRIAILKGGKDPDDILKKYGAEYFENIISTAKPYTEYLLDKEKTGADLYSMEGKINYARQTTSILLKVSDPLERELYIKKLAADLDISEDLIKNEYQKQVKGQNRREKNRQEYKEKMQYAGRTPLEKLSKSLTVCEGELINIIINSPPGYARLKTSLPEDFFTEPLYNKVYAMRKEYKDGQAFDINMIIDRLEGNEKGQISMLVLKQTRFDDMDRTIQSLLERISLLKNRINISKSDDLSILDEEIRKLRNKIN